MGKRIITATDVREAAQAGQLKLLTPSDTCIVTPMAMDEADSLGVVLSSDGQACPEAGACAAGSSVPSSARLTREVCELLKARLPADTPIAKLETVIREVVTAKLGEAADLRTTGTIQPVSAHGVRIVDHQRLIEGENGPIPVDEKMWVAEAIGGEAEEKLAGGFMIWEKASFTRRVEQAEIAVVLEGELHLNVDGNTLTGSLGDMVYFPKGAVVVYSTPGRVKLACVNCI